jgi:hypothetical protein
MAKGKASTKANKKAAKAKIAVMGSNNSAKKVKKARRKESYAIYIFKVRYTLFFNLSQK